MPRSGVIGQQIFDQVEKLVKGGAMTRSDAFKQISSETGRREGTVAANYYRVARQRAGGPLRPRRRGRARAAPSTRARRTATTRAAGASGDVDALTRSLVENVQALAAAMNAQAAEVKELRSRLDGVRKLLA
jgi:hypothetical protein